VIIGIWIFLQCRRHSISIQRLVRTIPSEHWNWAYLSLALPLFLLSIGIVWVNLWLRHLLLLRFGPSVATSWLGHHPRLSTRHTFKDRRTPLPGRRLESDC
jgi:hypothetical protein